MKDLRFAGACHIAFFPALKPRLATGERFRNS